MFKDLKQEEIDILEEHLLKSNNTFKKQHIPSYFTDSKNKINIKSE